MDSRLDLKIIQEIPGHKSLKLRRYIPKLSVQNLHAISNPIDGFDL